MLLQKFNYTHLNRSSVDGKRHYCLPDGSKVPSVTTILDESKSEEKKKILMDWKRRVGQQKAQEISTESASRGTRMHKWLETYIKTDDMGSPGSNPYSQQSFNMANNIVCQALSKHVNEYWGVEVPLYYSGLYAGTSDCVGIWKGKPAILDFKQTNKLKKREWIDDYFIQLAAYAMAHNNMFGTDIKTGVILMCSADNVYQEFEVLENEFEHWSNQWLDRVNIYYSKH